MENGDSDIPCNERDNLVIAEFEPIWEEALNALQGYERSGQDYVYTGKFNAGPVGKLMATGETPPPEILRIIGSMLAPPRGWRGARFTIATPAKRGLQAHVKNQACKRQIRIRFQELRSQAAPGSFEADVQQVMSEFKRGRSFVIEAIKLSDLDIVRSMYDPRHFITPADKPDD